jgi:RNA polymerase sigma factor (sigma-70 family)
MAHIRPNRAVEPRLRGKAFSRLYLDHSERLIGFFMRRVFDAQAAMDLTAETFAQALISRRRFRGDSDAELEAWIWAIARNQLARYQRKGRAERRAVARLGIQTPIVGEDDHERIERLAGIDSFRGAIAAAMSELSDGHREAVRLRVIDELPYPTVAARLGISETNARARVSRGLRALAVALEQEPQIQEVSR